MPAGLGPPSDGGSGISFATAAAFASGTGMMIAGPKRCIAPESMMTYAAVAPACFASLTHLVPWPRNCFASASLVWSGFGPTMPADLPSCMRKVSICAASSLVRSASAATTVCSLMNRVTCADAVAGVSDMTNATSRHSRAGKASRLRMRMDPPDSYCHSGPRRDIADFFCPGARCI